MLENQTQLSPAEQQRVETFGPLAPGQHTDPGDLGQVLSCTVRSRHIAYVQPRGPTHSSDLPLGIPACEDKEDSRRCTTCPNAKKPRAIPDPG